jgi:hypothetical protein
MMLAGLQRGVRTKNDVVSWYVQAYVHTPGGPARYIILKT